MSTQDRIDELVRQSLWYDRLYEMGMIGPQGRKATSEASRRNSVIRNSQKALGITKSQLRILKEEAVKKGDFL